ncbi:hypothetical protein BS78_03G375900 [Paspalum vaginatum]|nr:hypothetical protein BS78_03G375900 [Paspalum vaginatum]
MRREGCCLERLLRPTAARHELPPHPLRARHHGRREAAALPLHACGAVQHHVVLHKESFEEQTKPMANHHAHGGGSHRYEAYEETFEEETTYSAGRHHGRREEYQTYEEVVVGGGGQLKRRCRGA